MASISSGAELSKDYFLRNFYQNNRSAVKSSKRKELTKNELSYEDSTALRRAVKQLDKYSYSDSENKNNIYNSITAFIDTYNNSVDSNSSTSASKYAKQLKKLISDHSDELSDIGIKVGSDGKMTYSENLLKNADMDKLKEVFGKESGLTRSLSGVAKRMHTISFDDVMGQALRGEGIGININVSI